MTVPGDPGSAARADRRAWLAFAICGGIWGSTFLVISIGNDSLAPIWAATLRLLLASALLAGWAAARGAPRPRGAALSAAAGYGVCLFGLNFPLLYWGQQRVPSGVAAVLYATIPLSSALLARMFGLERLTARKLGGAVIALAGVAVLFSQSFGAELPASGLLAVFGGASTTALGNTLLKRGPAQDPIAANATGCVIGALMSGAASLALGEVWRLPRSWHEAWPILYLTLAGSLGAFVLMSWLIRRWPITRTAYVTVIVPVIALTLGVLVRGESLSARGLAGAALVLLGVLVGMRARPARGA